MKTNKKKVGARALIATMGMAFAFSAVGGAAIDLGKSAAGALKDAGDAAADSLKDAHGAAKDALKDAQLYPDQPLGEIAAEILELSDLEDGDDATVAVIRLTPP